MFPSAWPFVFSGLRLHAVIHNTPSEIYGGLLHSLNNKLDFLPSEFFKTSQITTQAFL